jgi:hypothetical protein
MISYFVRYRGSSPDSAAFHSYYETRHADILRGLPAIRSLVLHTPVAWADPFPVKPGGSALVAQMIFDTAGVSTPRCARSHAGAPAMISAAFPGSKAR